MASNRACRLWVNMIRTLDVEMMVPQHGRPFKGKKMIKDFLDWLDKLPCGVDLLTKQHYSVPGKLSVTMKENKPKIKLVK